MIRTIPLPFLAIGAVLSRMIVYALMAIPFGGLADAMCQYDCGWYTRLAMEGYGSNSLWDTLGPVPNWAFFPLFPILVRVATGITGLSPEMAGLLLANALFVGFVLLAVVYLRRSRAVVNAPLWVLFAVLFPFGYIFSAVYTESLFALLTIAVLLALQRRRILLAAWLTALLCATRPTGVLMIPLIAAERLGFLWRNRQRPDRLALLGEALLPLAIAPLGLSLYMAYQYAMIGDALAFSHVQMLWDRVWIGPVQQLWNAFAAWDWALVLSPNGLPSQSYCAAWAVLGLAVAGWLAWRRRWAEAWLLAASILLPLSTAMHSLPRFVASNPFFLFACFDGLQALRGRLTFRALAGAGIAVQAVVIAGWFISANSLY